MPPPPRCQSQLSLRLASPRLPSHHRLGSHRSLRFASHHIHTLLRTQRAHLASSCSQSRMSVCEPRAPSGVSS
eukprot:2055872-Rhodomonas_salina.1